MAARPSTTASHTTASRNDTYCTMVTLWLRLTPLRPVKGCPLLVDVCPTMSSFTREPLTADASMLVFAGESAERIISHASHSGLKRRAYPPLTVSSFSIRPLSVFPWYFDSICCWSLFRDIHRFRVHLNHRKSRSGHVKKVQQTTCFCLC